MIKKTIILSLVTSGLLLAGNPIHEQLDIRISGKSYGGHLDDSVAAQDGLGTLGLQHHSGTSEINNELKIQKILHNTLKSELNDSLKTNIKESLSNGLSGSVENQQIIASIESNNNSIPTVETCYGQTGTTASGKLIVDQALLFAMVNTHTISDLSNICTSNVTNMKLLFDQKPFFNQDISNWDVSNVTNMNGMFSKASNFNQDISGWDVSNVIDMYGMFYLATSFNQDISSWNISNVNNMDYYFAGAYAFNQDLSSWYVPLIPSKPIGFNSDPIFTGTVNFGVNQPIVTTEISNNIPYPSGYSGFGIIGNHWGNGDYGYQIHLDRTVFDSINPSGNFKLVVSHPTLGESIFEQSQAPMFGVFNILDENIFIFTLLTVNGNEFQLVNSIWDPIDQARTAFQPFLDEMDNNNHEVTLKMYEDGRLLTASF